MLSQLLNKLFPFNGRQRIPIEITGFICDVYTDDVYTDKSNMVCLEVALSSSDSEYKRIKSECGDDTKLLRTIYIYVTREEFIRYNYRYPDNLYLVFSYADRSQRSWRFWIPAFKLISYEKIYNS